MPKLVFLLFYCKSRRRGDKDKMVTINGEPQEKNGVLLPDFLAEAGYDSRAVAVEYNGDILAKEDYAATRLKDGDVVEVVCFMGGGC